MSNPLGDFHGDSYVKESVKEYLLDFLSKKAIEKVFKREDTSGVTEARQLIDEAFDNLDTMFQSEPKPKIENEAR